MATATSPSRTTASNGGGKRRSPRSGKVERRPGVVGQRVLDPVEATDPVTEMLARYGFTYSLVSLDLSKVNRQESERNQARISKPIDDDQVVLYAEAMKAGDKFPPIVVYALKNDFIVMDGNHRVAAADIADLTELPAYIVEDPSPAQVETFTYEANTKHGLPTLLQDRLRQSIYLVDKGVTATAAASALGVPLSAVNNALAGHRTEKRFAALGNKAYNRLGVAARKRLNAIPTDPVLKAAADLVLQAGLTGDAVADLVKKVNLIHSGERDQLAFIQSQRAGLATQIKSTAGGRIPTPTALRTLSRSARAINDLNVPELAQLVGQQSRELRDDHVHMASEAATRLLDFVRAVRAADER